MYCIWITLFDWLTYSVMLILFAELNCHCIFVGPCRKTSVSEVRYSDTGLYSVFPLTMLTVRMRGTSVLARTVWSFCLLASITCGPFFIESQRTSLFLATFRPAIFAGHVYFSIMFSNNLSFGCRWSPSLKINSNFSSTFSSTLSPLSKNCAIPL